MLLQRATETNLVHRNKLLENSLKEKYTGRYNMILSLRIHILDGAKTSRINLKREYRFSESIFVEILIIRIIWFCHWEFGQRVPEKCLFFYFGAKIVFKNRSTRSDFIHIRNWFGFLKQSSKLSMYSYAFILNYVYREHEVP